MINYRLFKPGRKNRFQDMLEMPASAKSMFACLQISIAAHLLGAVYTEQEIPITYGIFLITLAVYAGFAAPSIRRLQKTAKRAGINGDIRRFWPFENLVLLWLGSRMSDEQRGAFRSVYYLQIFSDLLLALCVLAVLPHLGKFLFYNINILQYIYYRFIES